jgi:hypothetical protein
LRHNGIPYKGINVVVMLWSAAAICGATWWRCAAPRRRPPSRGRRCSPCADHRPAEERNADERYREPSLFTVLERRC